MVPYCHHLCGECAGGVSHYRTDCTEGYVLYGVRQHPDCKPQRDMTIESGYECCDCGQKCQDMHRLVEHMVLQHKGA